MNITQALLLFAISLFGINCLAQRVAPKAADLTVVNRKLSFGKDGSLHLNEADNAGFAWLKGRQFQTGTIEFDVKGSDKLQASFVGIAFHGVNDTTYECVYFRPFNFLAADPVRKSHGVQYIAIPNFDWPILRKNHPNKYEQAVIPAPDPNGWFHARIVVNPEKIKVYVNGNQTAVLQVDPIVSANGTKIGYWVGFGSAGDWKNLKITDTI